MSTRRDQGFDILQGHDGAVLGHTQRGRSIGEIAFIEKRAPSCPPYKLAYVFFSVPMLAEDGGGRYPVAVRTEEPFVESEVSRSSL